MTSGINPIHEPAPAIPTWLGDELNALRLQLIHLHRAATQLSNSVERDDNDLRRLFVPDVVQTAEKIETLLKQSERLFCDPLIVDLLGAYGRVIN